MKVYPSIQALKDDASLTKRINYTNQVLKRIPQTDIEIHHERAWANQFLANQHTFRPDCLCLYCLTER